MTTDTIVQIPLADLHDSPSNPRQTYNDADLAELGADIKATGRVLQPLLVRPRVPALFANAGDPDAQVGYEIVFGHRRKRGAELAGLETAPCMVRSMSDLEVKRAQISENLQRKDVHPIEEAEGFQALIDEHNETADRIAEQVGKSRSYVYGRLKLLQACPLVRRACLAGDIDTEVALLIARVGNSKLQEKALDHVKGRNVNVEDGGKKSYRQVRDLLAERFTLDLNEAPFPTEEEMLVPAAGNCLRCTKRAGNAPEFEDLANDRPGMFGRPIKGNPDACTDPDCFQAKKVAFFKRKADELRAKGAVVVDGNKARQAVDAYGRLKDTYVEVSKVKDELKKAKTTSTAAPAEVIIQDPRTGKTMKVVAKADLQKALGIDPAKPASSSKAAKSKAGDSYAEQARQREEKAKAETAHRTALLQQVRAALRTTERTADEARVVVQVLLSELLESEVSMDLLEAWKLPHYRDGNALAAALKAKTRGEVALIMLDCVTAMAVNVDSWDIDTIPIGLHAIAALHGIPTDPAATQPLAAPAPKDAAQATGKAETKLKPVQAWPFPGTKAAEGAGAAGTGQKVEAGVAAGGGAHEVVA